MKIDNWVNKNANLTGKTIAITGSSGGIVSEMVKTLAHKQARFIFINRGKEKTQKQIEELKQINPNIDVEFIQCDLSDFLSVKNAVTILQQREIDILFLGAGVYNVPRYKTSVELDNVFQVNFLSHYYMVKQLLDTIKKRNGKIVAVGSIAYKYSKTRQEDIDFSNEKKHSKVYGNSKRYLMFALQELAYKENVKLSVVHPGITLTEMTNHYPKFINWLVKIGIKLFFTKKRNAYLPLIKGLCEHTNKMEWIGPSKFNIWGKPCKKIIKGVTQEEISQIFNNAEMLYKGLNRNLQVD